MEKLLDNAIDITDEILLELSESAAAVTLCYNQATVWRDREEATLFYLQGMCECEGCEKERYTNVLLDLMAGRMVCHDGVTEFLTWETEYR